VLYLVVRSTPFRKDEVSEEFIPGRRIAPRSAGCSKTNCAGKEERMPFRKIEKSSSSILSGTHGASALTADRSVQRGARLLKVREHREFAPWNPRLRSSCLPRMPVSRLNASSAFADPADPRSGIAILDPDPADLHYCGSTC